MRSDRAIRRCAVITAILGLAVTLGPASGVEEKAITFTGTADLGAGLDYPCAETLTTLTTGGSWTPGEVVATKGDKDCPAIPTVCPNGATDCLNKKGKPLDTGGNTRAGAFTSQANGCAYAGVAIMKAPDKSDGPHTGLCGIRATFVVTGYCGLSQGQGRGTIDFTELLAGATQRDAHFKFTWFDPGSGVLVILGNYWYGTATPPPSGQYEGDIVGVAKATPLPTIPPGGNNCFNKTARTFVIEAAATFTHPKCLPEHEERAPSCIT